MNKWFASPDSREVNAAMLGPARAGLERWWKLEAGTAMWISQRATANRSMVLSFHLPAGLKPELDGRNGVERSGNAIRNF